MLWLHAIANPSVICEDWCHEPCTQLNGNVQLECGGCSAEGGYSCFPHAAGWSDWLERARPPAGGHEPSTMPAIGEAAGEAREKEPDGRTRATINDEPRRMFVAPGSGAVSESLSHESVPIEESAVLSASEALPCQRVTAPELRAVAPAGRAALFARPTLVSGLIDDWRALREWSDAAGFARHFGEHGVLAKRLSHYENARTASSGQDPTRTLVRLREALANADQMHVVLYNGEQGNAEAEEALLSDIRASGGYGCPEPMLARACSILVLSLGGGREGVRFANHGFAWIGLVGGMKLWHVAPHDSPRPPNPTCADRARIEALPNVTHCLQRPGEVMVVPTAWWHATCNLGEYTLGVGGQDSCDLLDCTPPGPPDEDPHELHMRKLFCLDEHRSLGCNGAYGAARARWHAERFERPAEGKFAWTLEHEEWLRGSRI